MSTTTQDQQTEVARLVDEYLSGWNEVDQVERQQIIERCWQPDAALVDPPLDGHGHEGIDALIRALQEHYPDHRFIRSGDIEAHHDAFRFPWRLVGPEGSDALRGVDYGLVGDDGRLTRVTGFFEPVTDDAGTTEPGR
jgi:hypothetical protein